MDEMAIETQTMNEAASPGRARKRVAGGFVLVVMFAACVVFWVGIPAGGLWGLGELTNSSVTHFLTALVLVPGAMLLFAPVLFWLNGLYLRVTGVLERLDEDEQQSGWRRRVRGPLESMLVVSFVIEFVALVIWFLLFAENPSSQVI